MARKRISALIGDIDTVATNLRPRLGEVGMEHLGEAAALRSALTRCCPFSFPDIDGPPPAL
jgi:hypothetical protein